MLYGRGAGAFPTGSAIIADILDAARGSARKTFTQLQFFQNPRGDLPTLPKSAILSRYYLRLMVTDQPGVMGKLANALGEREISIASLIQKEEQLAGKIPIVILTHQTAEGRFLDAVRTLAELPFVAQPPIYYHLEN
jgi:homoserine dehydrogenase